MYNKRISQPRFRIYLCICGLDWVHASVILIFCRRHAPMCQIHRSKERKLCCPLTRIIVLICGKCWSCSFCDSSFEQDMSSCAVSDGTVSVLQVECLWCCPVLCCCCCYCCCQCYFYHHDYSWYFRLCTLTHDVLHVCVCDNWNCWGRVP